MYKVDQRFKLLSKGLMVILWPPSIGLNRAGVFRKKSWEISFSLNYKIYIKIYLSVLLCMFKLNPLFCFNILKIILIYWRSFPPKDILFQKILRAQYLFTSNICCVVVVIVLSSLSTTTKLKMYFIQLESFRIYLGVSDHQIHHGRF